MSANTLHIDLPPKHSPSVVPWIIVLACTAILLILCSQLLQSIPASLQAQAEQQLDTQEYPDVSVASNGRQLELSGNIDISQSPDKLVSSLANINGVREVVSKLVIVDPAVKAAEDAELFSRAIASVDVSSIRFQPGSVNFTPDSNAALSQLLEVMELARQGLIRIEGHTDNTGPDSVNLRVSRDRAQAVANYLMARGIAADRVLVAAYGSTQPIASNDTEAGRADNRRIEINEIN